MTQFSQCQGLQRCEAVNKIACFKSYSHQPQRKRTVVVRCAGEQPAAGASTSEPVPSASTRSKRNAATLAPPASTAPLTAVHEPVVRSEKRALRQAGDGTTTAAAATALTGSKRKGKKGPNNADARVAAPAAALSSQPAHPRKQHAATAAAAAAPASLYIQPAHRHKQHAAAAAPASAAAAAPAPIHIPQRDIDLFTLPPAKLLEQLKACSTKRELLAVCQDIAARKLALGRYSVPDLVALLVLMSNAGCGSLEGAPEAAGAVFEFLAGAKSKEPMRQFLPAAMREGMPAQLVPLLPSLLRAAERLKCKSQDAWSLAARLAHSHLHTYSGAQVSGLVQALAAAGLTQELCHPAMLKRCSQLACDGGIGGDDTAALLCSWVACGASMDPDLTAALLRRALQDPQLSPRGALDALTAISRYCRRFKEGPSEMVCLLERYQSGILGLLLGALARTLPSFSCSEQVNIAFNLAHMRMHHRAIFEGAAGSVVHALKSGGSADTRDMTSALYACALLDHPAPALFDAASSALAPRLEGLAVQNLARVAWAYAVARQEGSRGFLKELVGVLDKRRDEVRQQHVAWGLVMHAVRIWASLRPELLQGAGGRRLAGALGDSTFAARDRANASELQREVFTLLREMGHQPEIEAKVGLWSVDILVALEDGVRLAIEVDGPTHFTLSAPRRLLGNSAARDACLAAEGLTVASLDHEAWHAASGAQRRRMLQKVVDEALG